jgi:hypothetical protein
LQKELGNGGPLLLPRLSRRDGKRGRLGELHFFAGLCECFFFFLRKAYPKHFGQIFLQPVLGEKGQGGLGQQGAAPDKSALPGRAAKAPRLRIKGCFSASVGAEGEVLSLKDRKIGPANHAGPFFS